MGVILYEALASVKPFVGATPLAIAAAAERGDHRPLSEARAGLPADLVVIDRDFLACPEDDIRRIEPLATVVNGRVVAGRL